MATYPSDPNLPAVTTITPVNPAFLNTLVDNINAIGADLADLSDNAGNIDLAIDKGLKWATVLEIYKSGGDLVLDDNVGITGNLDVTGTITGVVSVSGSLDIPGTLSVDTINDSGAATITVMEDMTFAVGKYVDAPTGKFDIISSSGAAQIVVNDILEMGVGKGLQGSGATTLAILHGATITGTLTVSVNLDVVGTLTVDTINDSGAASISVMEDMELAAGKYIDAPTGKFDNIDSSGAANITLDKNVYIQGIGDDVSLLLRNYIGIYGSTIGSPTFIYMKASPDDPGYPGSTGMNMYVNSSGDLYIKTKGTFTESFIVRNNPPNYTVTNEQVDRSYDADTVVIAELADVVGTIINDLIYCGIFK